MSLDRLPNRFRNKIAVAESGCWLWTGATDKRGYGRVNMGRGLGVKFSHRVVFTMLRNDPGDLVLDHLCRVHSCVNPEHLEPVTHAENVRRGVSAAVHVKLYAEHLWCPQNHPLFGENLYAHTNRNGHVNKQCRTCRARRDRERRARLRAEQDQARGELGVT